MSSPKPKSAIPQVVHRQAIDVGPGMYQVSPVGYWWKHGHYTVEQAQGAFALAYQQGMDGMGRSVSQWMGITEEELGDWIRDKRLPQLSKKTIQRLPEPPAGGSTQSGDDAG